MTAILGTKHPVSPVEETPTVYSLREILNFAQLPDLWTEITLPAYPEDLASCLTWYLSFKSFLLDSAVEPSDSFNKERGFMSD